MEADNLDMAAEASIRVTEEERKMSEAQFLSNERIAAIQSAANVQISKQHDEIQREKVLIAHITIESYQIMEGFNFLFVFVGIIKFNF